MRSLFIASLLFAATTAFAQATLKDAEGLWYAKDQAVDVKIENNTLTVVRSETKMKVTPGFGAGTVLGVADGAAKKINDHATAFTGTCWSTSDGKTFKLMKCTAAYTLIKGPHGREYDFISSSEGAFYRKSFFAKSGQSFEARD